MKVIHLELPPNLTAGHIAEKLGEQVPLQHFSKQYGLKTFYDTFDWRLYRNGLICELNRSRQTSTFTLTDRKNGDLAASSILFDVPSFSRQFNPGKVRKILEPLLEMRALLPVSTLECESSQVNVVNEDEKIVLRLLIEEYALLNNRISLFPVKGHEKIARHVVAFLTENMAAKPAVKSILLDTLHLQGRHPKDYSSKLAIALSPGMSAEAAGHVIFNQLLRTVKTNEQGTIADTDSEFLHDFRVAVRRTRVALGQFKGFIPEDAYARHKAFFSRLGKLTGDTRDLDVYLLNFDSFKDALPSEMRQSINPLHHFLQQKKVDSHRKLAKQLQSAEYLTALAEWEAFILRNPPIVTDEPNAYTTVKTFADGRIWKVYKQVIKQGDAIDADAPPEALHRLRKTCKKLRYLIEFFQSLYPERELEKILKILKRLQEVLGHFQDFAVQQKQLTQFGDEMQAVNTPSKTFVAIGVLIQEMENRKVKVRRHFGVRFRAFRKKSSHETFERLFSNG